MHLRSPPRFLIFTHARHRPDRYGRSGRFETGAFERELAWVREDDRAVAIEMLGEADPVAAGEQLVELALRCSSGRQPQALQAASSARHRALTPRQPFRVHRCADQFRERRATHGLHPRAGGESCRHVENVNSAKHQDGQDQCRAGSVRPMGHRALRLHRVHPPLADNTGTGNGTEERGVTGGEKALAEASTRATLAEARLSDFKSMLDDIREQRDRWRQQAERLAALAITDQRKEPAPAQPQSWRQILPAPTGHLLFLWVVGLMCGGVLFLSLKGGS